MAGPSTPVGPITAPPGQYTHCVDRKDYVENPEKWGFFDASVPARLEFALCEYLLGGKLVCLAGGGDECVIGTVVGIEEVGYQKSGFDAIDNDFSFNVLVSPYAPDDFASYHPATPPPPPPPGSGEPAYGPHRIRDDVKSSPLGYLLDDPTPAPVPLPEPSKPGDVKPVDGYGVAYRWDDATKRLGYDHDLQNNLTVVWQKTAHDGSVITIPIVHCECEGSRIYFVCQAMKPFLELLQGKVPGSPLPGPGAACHKALDWVPFGIGKAFCNLVEDLVAIPIALAIGPAALAAFGAAWEAAQAYDDLFVTGPVSRQVELGDEVIVNGRWTWDAGHAGHTELHPVKSFQHVQLRPGLRGGHDPKLPLDPSDRAELEDLHRRWCRHVQEAPPPPDPLDPTHLSPAQLASLSPEQLGIYASQQRPENGWTLHPAIDGCSPNEDGRVVPGPD